MLNVSKIDNFTKLAKQNDQEIDFGGVGEGRKRGGVGRDNGDHDNGSKSCQS